MPLNAFKWKNFVGEIILQTVKWYLKYPLSYRNLNEMMAERGIKVHHTTIMRWVHQYSPEIKKRIRRHLIAYYIHLNSYLFHSIDLIFFCNGTEIPISYGMI